jgi:hypothetical protein
MQRIERVTSKAKQMQLLTRAVLGDMNSAIQDLRIAFAPFRDQAESDGKKRRPTRAAPLFERKTTDTANSSS